MAALLRRVTGLAQFSTTLCINQLTGETFENPCPYVSQTTSLPRRFEDLPRLPTVPALAGAVVTYNNKKRKFEKEFPDPEDVIDLR